MAKNDARKELVQAFLDKGKNSPEPSFYTYDGSPYPKKIPKNQLNNHEMVYTEEGEIVPNPVSSGGLVDFVPLATSAGGLLGQTLQEGVAYMVGQKSTALAVATGLTSFAGVRGYGLQRKFKQGLTQEDIATVLKKQSDNSDLKKLSDNLNINYINSGTTNKIKTNYPKSKSIGDFKEESVIGWASPSEDLIKKDIVNIVPVPWARRFKKSRNEIVDQVADVLTHEKWHTFQYRNGTVNFRKYDIDGFGEVLEPIGNKYAKTLMNFGKLPNYGMPINPGIKFGSKKAFYKSPKALIKHRLSKSSQDRSFRAWARYVMEPLEVEARIAEMWVSKTPFKTRGYQHLKRVGYNDLEIADLRTAFSKTLAKRKESTADWLVKIREQDVDASFFPLPKKKKIKDTVTLYRGVDSWKQGSMVKSGKFIGGGGLSYKYGRHGKDALWTTARKKLAEGYKKGWKGNDGVVLEFEVPTSFVENAKKGKNYLKSTVVFDDGLPKEFLKKVHKK